MLIVIATYNGKKYLANLLEDIKKFDISNDKICVVDNKSDDESHLSYLKELEEQNYKILHNPEPSYCIGALLYALKNFESDVWFLLQDSNRIKKNIFEIVCNKLTDDIIYALLTFDHGVSDGVVSSRLKEVVGTIDYTLGIFGSQIFAKNSVMQKIKNDLFVPKNKMDDMTSERAVSVICDKYNIKIIGLGHKDDNIMASDGYDYFTKIYGGRI